MSQNEWTVVILAVYAAICVLMFRMGRNEQ
jgi:hypothetical protein